MQIGVDATCWQNGRGYGRHARSLLGALVRLDSSNHYTFFMDCADNYDGLPPEAEVRLVRAAAPTAVAASSNGHRSYRDMWRMSRAMSDPDFDLLLFPTVYSYVPVLSRAKKMVMIHDIIAETYPELTLPRLRSRLFWKAKVALGRWQADAVLTVSDYSREGILKQFRIASERVFVVGEASDSIFRLLPEARPTARLVSLGMTGVDRSVAYVGGFSPHKNLEVLVDVFAKLVSTEEFSDTRLIMVGENEKEVFHSYSRSIRERAEKLGVSDRVVFTGYLPDEEVVILLNLSTVLVLPSLMEGFGLPAVEAAACGCPVIATNASPLPGLLGNAAIYVDPGRPEELEAALTQVLTSTSLRKRMSEEGRAAAGKLTWDAAAQQMIGLLQHVVAQ